MHTLLGLSWVLAMLASGSQASACATCGCSLSSDGAAGFTTTAG